MIGTTNTTQNHKESISNINRESSEQDYYSSINTDSYSISSENERNLIPGFTERGNCHECNDQTLSYHVQAQEQDAIKKAVCQQSGNIGKQSKRGTQTSSRSKAIKKKENQHDNKIAQKRTLPCLSERQGRKKTNSEVMETELCNQVTGLSEDTTVKLTRGDNSIDRQVISKEKQLELIVSQLKTYLFDLTCLLPLIRDKSQQEKQVQMPSLPYVYFFAEMLNTLHQQATLYGDNKVKFEQTIRQFGLIMTQEEVTYVQKALLRSNLMKFVTYLFVSINSKENDSDENRLTILLKIQQHICKDNTSFGLEDIKGIKLVQNLIDLSFQTTAESVGK